MTGTRGGRWPPRRGRGDPGPHGEWPPPVEWQGAIGDISTALQAMTPTAVLGEATYLLDSAGGAGDQYRIPFAALHVTSMSGSLLTVAASPRMTGAPRSGPGVALIPPGASRVCHMKGYAWSVYGGSPGEAVTVEAFTRPVPPVFEYGNQVTPRGPASVYATGVTGAAPAANTAIVTLPVLAAGWWTVTVDVGFGGTAEATTNFNFALKLGATVLYPSFLISAAPNTIRTAGAFRVLSDGVSQLVLYNPVVGSAGSVYTGALRADQ